MKQLKKDNLIHKIILNLLYVILIVGLMSCDKNEVSGEKKTNKIKSEFIKTDSRQLREVKINNHIFMIPNYYIAQNFGDGKLVTMYAYWPELRPYRQLNTNKERNRLLDRIEIIIDGTNNVLQSPKRDLYDVLKKDQRLREAFYNEKLQMWEYQYKVALDEISRRRHYLAKKNSIHVPYDRSFSIRCNNVVRIKKEPGSIQCNVDYFIRDDLILTYRFFHKHINDWKMIDLQVRNLVETFFKGK